MRMKATRCNEDMSSSSGSSLDYRDSNCYDGSDQSYDSTPLCTTKRRVINPNDLIRSSNDSWQFDRSFSQSIEVEVCENAGAPCNDYPMLRTKCRQRYLSIQLQVISRNGTRRTKSQLKSFTIPSNCECVFFRRRWVYVFTSHFITSADQILNKIENPKI